MDNAARVNLLSRLAIGDEIDAADNDAAVGFAADVAARCKGHAGPAGRPRWRRRLSAVIRAGGSDAWSSRDVKGLLGSVAMERVWNAYGSRIPPKTVRIELLQ